MAPRVPRGLLVTLEGGEGCGKTTQAQALSRLLRQEGYPVTLTREPAGTELGRLVKGFFREEGGGQGRRPAVGALAELLLFEAARAQHLEEVIRPALARGDLVLCDRFTDSTLAYQGYGRGLSLDQVRACNQIATGGLVPELTLLLDLPPEEGLARKGSEPLPDAIGREPLEFHRRVRAGFLQIARREPQRVVVLDASRPPEKVTAEAWQHLRRLLERLS